MWTQAQIAMESRLKQLGAHLIDNIVLVDQGSTMASFITTPRWLLTGRSNAFWGLPAAGVSEQDIKRASRFGKAIADGLAQNLEKSGQAMLTGLGAVNADVALIQSEKIGYRSFRIWGKILRTLGDQDSIPRKSVLILYIVFLVSAILTIVPLILLVRKCMGPFLKARHQRLKTAFEKPSGSDLERVEEYTCQS